MDELRILMAYQSPPYHDTCAKDTQLLRDRETCNNPGFVAESIGYVLHKAAIKYTVKHLSDGNNWALLDIFSLLVNESSDAILEALTPSKERQALGMKFTNPLPSFDERYVAVSSLSEQISTIQEMTLVTGVFSYELWAAIIAVFCVFLLFDKVLPPMLLGRDRPKPAKSSLRAGMLLLFFLAIFDGLFEGSLVSQLLTQSISPRFQSLKELNRLVKGGHAKLVFKHQFNWHMQIMNYPQTSMQKELRDALLENPAIEMWSLFPDKKYWKDMANGKVIFITDSMTGMKAAMTIPGTKVTALDDLGVYMNSIALKPTINHKIIERLNQVLIYEQENLALIRHRYVTMLELEMSLAVSKHSVPRSRAMIGKTAFNLMHLLILFILLGVGSVLGLLILLVELGVKNGKLAEHQVQTAIQLAQEQAQGDQKGALGPDKLTHSHNRVHPEVMALTPVSH